MEALIVVLLVLWLAPILVAQQLGFARNRHGWAWGLLLSWLGVLILACMTPLPVEQRRVKPN